MKKLGLRNTVELVNYVRNHGPTDSLCHLARLALVELGLHKYYLDLLLLRLVDQHRQGACTRALALVLDRYLDKSIVVGEIAQAG
jgi:hypothetical protein